MLRGVRSASSLMLAVFVAVLLGLSGGCWRGECAGEKEGNKGTPPTAQELTPRQRRLVDHLVGQRIAETRQRIVEQEDLEANIRELAERKEGMAGVGARGARGLVRKQMPASARAGPGDH